MYIKYVIIKNQTVVFEMILLVFPSPLVCTHMHTYTHISQITAAELKMVLLLSDQMINNNHPKSHDIMTIMDKLTNFHDDFQCGFKGRGNLLEDLVGFNHTAQNVRERGSEQCS